MAELSRRARAGSIVAGLFVMIPALIVTGFMPELDVLPWWAWLGVCALGGAASGALWDERRPLLGAAAGLVGGGCVLAATVAYILFRAELSDTFLTVEFVIPMLIGALPGGVIHWVGHRVLG